jgi:hypothetical protein
MCSDARVERVAVGPVVFFFDLRICVRHRDRCDICSGQCDNRALVLPNETGMIGTKVVSQCWSPGGTITDQVEVTPDMILT